MSDAPVGCRADLLDFHRYVDPVVSILADPRTETPFTIGVFGAWGSGKSTVLRMAQERLADGHPDRFLVVEFNPWAYRKEQNLLVPLLHTLVDRLDAEPGGRFKESAKKIANVLLRMGADVLLKKLTADAVSLDRLEELERKYFEEQGRVHSEIRNLRETLRKLAEGLGDGRRLLFLIDDLDRCDPLDIVDLLESIKLFLDVPGAFFVLSLAKEVIDQGLAKRYTGFASASTLAEDYLEKMVQLPVHLLPLHQRQVRRFVERNAEGRLAKRHLDLLASVLVPNPRKIKRVLNSLTVLEALTEDMERTAEGPIVRLAVLRAQASSLYADTLAHPDLLAALELLAGGDLRLDLNAFAGRFGRSAPVLHEIAKRHHAPGGWVEELFRNAGFAAVPDRIPSYLAVFGA